MDFLKLVNDGVKKSNKALAAVAEVDEIYKRINTELKEYPAGELAIHRKISTRAQFSSIAEGIAGVASGVAIESEYFRHDRIEVVLKVDGKSFSEDVAGWKQRVTGYPCILKFDGQELTCGSDAHLLSGMSELLSSVGFGSAVNRLIKAATQNAAAHQQKNNALAPTRSDESNSPETKLTLIKRSASQGQNVAAKTAEGRGAAKPASRRRTANKSAGSKVAAKPIAAKKPVAPKIPKKPVAPTASRRPVAPKKPASSKGTQKPEMPDVEAGTPAQYN